ncbi:MAG TPA: 30S ribosomal protein THX [Gemmatimonadales bacterium]|nr:30S ribosomal protein THX [Gemmatimonadales bacterium]
MGKGDLRSKRGKIYRGTYGNTRRRKKKRAKGAKQQEETREPRRP